MKVSASFLQKKNETAQMVLALQDPDRLERVRKALTAVEPTPQVILDRIDRGRAESKAGLCTPVEDFLEEMESW
jgi:hypothetical protein